MCTPRQTGSPIDRSGHEPDGAARRRDRRQHGALDPRPRSLASARVPRGGSRGRSIASAVALGVQGPGGSGSRPRDRGSRAVKRISLLALAAIIYAVAAWMVAPGFYDGFGPTQAYNWTCPPPQAGANNKPMSGHVVIKVIDGSSDP